MAKYRLGDIAPVKQGIVPDSDQYWLLNLDAVESNTGNVLEYVYVDYSQIGASTVSFNQQNVLYSKLRPYLNKVVLPDRAGYATSEMLPLMPDEKVITREYLTFFLRSPHFVEYINGKTSGAKMPRANIADLKAVEIECPPINEQTRIVSKINSILTIIAYRKNELLRLDELIIARFVEMFGDETNPYNWPVVNVEEVANVSVGVVIKPAQYYTNAEHGVKAFRSLNIGPMTIKDGDWVYFSREGNVKNAKSQLKENDLLIVRSGAPGTACVVPKQYEGCNAIDIIIARPNTERINPYYLCTYTNMPHGKRQIEEGTGGAAQQHFNVGKYNKLRLMLPPMDLQKEFVEFVAHVDKSKLLEARQARFIAKTRPTNIILSIG